MTTDADFDPPAGICETLQDGLRRILAPNPSPMTWRGTNSYILGKGRVALIDPGPDSPAHFDAIMSAVKGEVVEAILVTHSHTDHSPLAGPISKATGAPVYAFGNSQSGRSNVMRALLANGMRGGGEGIDHGFAPDECLADGDHVGGTGWQVQALWTPGHIGNHMCFSWNGVLFTGDHVMGWASSLVSPPDGDLTQFMASSRKLAKRQDEIYYPGHGAPVTDPARRIEWLIRHREQREAQILDALGTTSATPTALTHHIYKDVSPALIPAAERNVLAHLIDLAGRGLVKTSGPISPDSVFSRI